MAMTYGRAGAAQSQKGAGLGGGQYKAFSAVDVEDRLTGSELKDYQAALKTLASPAQLKKSGTIKKKYLRQQESAMDQANRLREIAASRAFSEFSSSAMQYSKPWLAQRPQEGLVRGQTINYGLARNPATSLSFAGEGVRAAGPSSPASLMGEYQFSPIGYESAKKIKKGKRLSNLSLNNQAGFSTTAAPVDFGNLNLSFGGY